MFQKNCISYLHSNFLNARDSTWESSKKTAFGPVQMFSFSLTCSVFSFSWTSSVFTKRGRQLRSWQVSLYFTSMKPPAAEFSFLICSLQLKSNPWSHFPSTSQLWCLRGRRSWCLGGPRCLAGLRLNRGAAGLLLHKFSHSARFGFQSRNLSLFMCLGWTPLKKSGVWVKHHNFFSKHHSFEVELGFKLINFEAIISGWEWFSVTFMVCCLSCLIISTAVWVT